ncbi:TRAF-type zinc finger domain-containing protein 1-like isoform X1 [Amphibalanus amphitrite]|uniref:TRAF-type zinc finger domain-containing protein 1-like isoform X1 n=2 Tax=Amphibalanus amphitrite TaxID=1232801 RepID=UPI001C918918|nr:TRAF-type zinc finger domain-containing protein 1-like isoform X1 [Amphibalanus amphitrite]
MGDTETIVCGNCQRAISAANHTVHVSHCRRHLSVCAECGEAVPRDRLEEHRAAEHRPVPCRLCGLQVPAGQMETHQEERCSGRAVTCPYCELSMPHSSLEEHESYCGSRTELCPTCQVRVMYRHWPLHVESGHRLTRPETDPGHTPKARGGRRPAAPLDDALDDGGALDDKIASYVRKPVDEIVEDTMEQWRRRKDLRRFEDDCFEQAMLMAIELSKKTATESNTVECEHCHLRFPADELRRHQSSCSWEQRRRQESSRGRSQGSAGSVGRDSSPPRWAAHPVADDPPEDAITLPCEFCEQAFLDADLLRHQLRCEKNPQRLDLPARRAPAPRPGGLTKSWSASQADREPRQEPEPEPAGSSRWRQPEVGSRRQEPESGWRQRLSGDLDGALARPAMAGGRRGSRSSDDLFSMDRHSPPRRWSVLTDPELTAPPAVPQRTTKHKKKVNFLGEDEFIHPVPEHPAEVADGDKKKKRSKEEKKQRKEEKKLKKRSSKKHRAPEPPGEPVITCDY